MLSGLVDFDAEKKRIERELAKLTADAAKLEKKLSNPGFLAKAAPEIIEKDRSKLASVNSDAARLTEQLAELA